MMLHEILPLLPGARFDAERLRRFPARDLVGVAVDSRRSGPGTVFVSLPERARSNPFEARAARERGAAVVVRERTDPASAPPGVMCIEVDDAGRAFGLLASALHGHPSRRLTVIGIGGEPRWRERVAGVMAGMLEAAGEGAAWMSGRWVVRGERRRPWEAWAMDAGGLQRELDQMALDGARTCVMELGEGAVDGGAVHGVEFRWVREVRRGGGHGLAVERLTARGSKARWDGVGGGRTLLTPLAGRSQVEALGQVLSILSEVGREPARLVSAAAAVSAAPGWMEPVQMGQRFGVLVDGADCADSLAEALADARELGHGRTLVVTGPRPGLGATALGAMARAVGRGSDAAWVTTDDLSEGEWEEAASGFASWAAAGGCRVTCERDRHRALARALGAAGPGDVVVLAGKGRRPVQAMGKARIPWDDGMHARAALASMGHVGGVL